MIGRCQNAGTDERFNMEALKGQNKIARGSAPGKGINDIRSPSGAK